MRIPDIYLGWHQPNNGPSGCGDFPKTLISVNRLIKRKSTFAVNEWIIDSGAFTRLLNGSHLTVAEYAEIAFRWSEVGNLQAIVVQDIICQPAVLSRLGITIERAQEQTISNYFQLQEKLQELQVLDSQLELDYVEYGDFDGLLESDSPEDLWTFPIPVIPVLQGVEAKDYINHLDMYRNVLLAPGTWVGVGSLKGKSATQIEEILGRLYKHDRYHNLNLRFHGFGITKKLICKCPTVRQLYSIDTCNHREGKYGASNNDPRYALKHLEELEIILSQPSYIQIEIPFA